MFKYRLMYDTGVSTIVTVSSHEEAEELADNAGANLMFWYLEEEISDA